MQSLVSQSKLKEIEVVLSRKGPDGESLKDNTLKEFNKSMLWQLTPDEGQILLNRLEILENIEQTTFNKKLIGILCMATIPASLTALVMILTNASIPPWLQAAALIEILMIEGMIAYFSGKISFMADKVTDVYAKIVEIDSDMRKPLEDLGKVMYEFRDILPIIAQIAQDIDKEQIKTMLIQWRESYTKDKTVQREELAAAAARITKAKKE